MNIAADQATLIDYSQIDGLLEAAGKEGVAQILEAFWKSTDSLFTQLRAEIAAAAFADAARTAHAIKGSAANVGASLLSGAAKDAEFACKAGDGAAAAEALALIDPAYERTREALIERVAAA